MPRTVPLVARLLFLGLALGFILQLPVRVRFGEPYPGLFGPPFGRAARGGSVTADIAVMSVVTSGGEDRSVSVHDVFPERGNPIISARKSLQDVHLFARRESRIWLCGRLSRAGFASPRRFDIVWERRTLYLRTGEVLKAYVFRDVSVERPCER